MVVGRAVEIPRYPPKPSEPIELEDIIDDYMPSNDEQDALAKSLMKDDLLEWVKSLVLNEVIGADDIYQGKNGHGTCCYCGTCRYDHDSCQCDKNAWREELRTKTKLISRRE